MLQVFENVYVTNEKSPYFNAYGYVLAVDACTVKVKLRTGSFEDLVFADVSPVSELPQPVTSYSQRTSSLVPVEPTDPNVGSLQTLAGEPLLTLAGLPLFPL